jgi:hypothetical protein
MIPPFTFISHPAFFKCSLIKRTDGMSDFLEMTEAYSKEYSHGDGFLYVLLDYG